MSNSKLRSLTSEAREVLARVGLTPHGLSCKLLLFFLLITHSALLPVSGAGSWKRQRASSLAWLHAVFFLDENNGWAAGSRGTLLMTSNAGRSWQLKTQPTEDTIRDIYFSDEQNGLLVCERNIYDLRSNDEPRAYLMKTADGGENWRRVNMRGAEIDARIMRAIFTRGGKGWAFGEGGTIFVTQDAGTNWTRLQTPTRYLLLGGAFVDETNGWLVGAGSTILQTMDGGETWHHSRLANTNNIRFNAASFVSSRLGWAVGSRGSIYRTVNGGRSWQQQNSGVASDLLDVKFFDALEGWAVGTEGTVLHTSDGGFHWINEPADTTHALERIFFADRLHGWAVGFGGTIVAYGRSAPPRLQH